MKNKTLHMIGNAPIDPVWLWQWQEGFHNDNHFCLLPQESKTIVAEWSDVPPAERALAVQGWNTQSMFLS